MFIFSGRYVRISPLLWHRAIVVSCGSDLICFAAGRYIGAYRPCLGHLTGWGGQMPTEIKGLRQGPYFYRSAFDKFDAGGCQGLVDPGTVIGAFFNLLHLTVFGGLFCQRSFKNRRGIRNRHRQNAVGIAQYQVA